MRGYGDSDKPASLSAYAMEHLIEDFRLIIEALDRKSCILVSHDWGGTLTSPPANSSTDTRLSVTGIVAWNFTSVHPEMVDRLIVMNCPHPAAFKKFMRTSLKQRLKSW